MVNPKNLPKFVVTHADGRITRVGSVRAVNRVIDEVAREEDFVVRIGRLNANGTAFRSTFEFNAWIRIYG